MNIIHRFKQTLTTLDLSGNAINVLGMRWLAMLLKTNKVRKIPSSFRQIVFIF